jgi:OOP family OmpA-OmpF porin
MKLKLIMTSLFFLSSFPVFAENDKEGCENHPLLTNKISGYYISDCSSNEYGEEIILNEKGEEQVVSGKKTVLIYSLNANEKGKSSVFITRNYQEAIKKIGGKIKSTNNGSTLSDLHIRKGDKEIWLKIGTYIGEGTPENTGQYIVTVIEKEGMKQEIVAKDILSEIKSNGRIALYIKFDTGKSDPKSESEPIIKEMGKILKQNPELKVYIVGHTDNQGNLNDNMKLSDSRANAIVKVLVTRYKIPVAQVEAKGVGSLSPIAVNDTEEGRELNRRVEMVKM